MSMAASLGTNGVEPTENQVQELGTLFGRPFLVDLGWKVLVGFATQTPEDGISVLGSSH